VLLDTAYSQQRKELTAKYGQEQQTVNDSFEKKIICREYLAEFLKLAIKYGEKEDAAHFEITLEDTIRMDIISLEIEKEMEEVEMIYLKTINITI
jgi:hypothetical protein